METAEGRALNHFNKLHKGRLVRALAESAPEIGSRADLLEWARGSGLDLRPRGDSDVVLVVPADAEPAGGERPVGAASARRIA